MTSRTLLRRSLRFHARSHLGVVLGAAIGSAALIGALVVGDSVRESLKQMALNRLGPVHFALSTQDRLFQSDLRRRLCGLSAAAYRAATPARPGLPYPPSICPQAQALILPAVVTKPDGSARANRVNVIGVDPAEWPRWANWERLGSNPGISDAQRDSLGQEHTAQVNWWPVGGPLGHWADGQTAFINQSLARQLSARLGDDLILRVRKPSALGLEAALSPRGEGAVALRLNVGAIVPPDLLGDFSLSSQQAPPANLFLPRDVLTAQLGLGDRANLLVGGQVLARHNLTGWTRLRLKWANWLRGIAPRRRVFLGRGLSAYGPDPGSPSAQAARLLVAGLTTPLPDEQAAPWLDIGLQRAWRLEDAQLDVRAIEPPQTATGGDYIRPFVEITSPRIFLEQSVIAAALKPRTELLTNHEGFQADAPKDLAFSQFVTNGVGVLTYLANLIRAGDRSTPYSMVTAAGPPFTPPGMRDDEILVNDRLAADLNVAPGDSVQLSYYVADSGSRLSERTNRFRVRAVVPLKGIYADRALMPEFPGLAKAESTRDWDAGFPLVHPIREKDEAYWKAYRGTPKAFVTLAAGQAMWANRFGPLTAIRYPVPTNTFASTCREAVYRNLLANLDPAQFGLRFETVREQALKAAEQGQDFGQLFLGFSIFLVVAALLLMALLFQFGLEQRATEVGTLLALGFTAKQVRRLFLAEGAALAFAGGILGATGGLGYAKAMLWALTTIWHSAVGASALSFHAAPATLIIGVCASTVVAAVTILLALRKHARQPARELLAGEVHSPQSRVHSRGGWVALASGFGALGIVGWALATGQSANAGAFFGAGALLLIAGLALAAAWLRLLAGRTDAARLTLTALGVGGCARRPRRSLATVALLACGCFVIVAIGVFRLDANQNAASRSSGTGGFALLGESTMPVVQDLNSKSGREFFGLSSDELAGVTIVPFRVRQGDDASCLNLNRAQQPRLLGVRPEALAGRFTFAEAAKGLDRRAAWELLRQSHEDGRWKTEDGIQTSNGAPLSSISHLPSPVPAIGDANSIEWALHKKVGDLIDYTDERGRAFKLRLVASVANSILQGSLVIDEAEFLKRFPGESGYRTFLIDAPSNSVAQVSRALSRALQDVGLELTPAVARLNAFNAVQNTYLGTFQILGGLGLLLGSAGLGVVVLRNVLERRGELGVLVAVGFRRRALERLVLSEHGALLALGLGLGIVSAAVAVLPALLSPGTQLPYVSVALTLGAVLLNGAAWAWLAARYALRGNLLETLRSE